MNDTELIRMAQNEYNREYRKNNPDKVKTWNHRYWLKRAQTIKRVQEEAPEPTEQTADNTKAYTPKKWNSTY